MVAVAALTACGPAAATGFVATAEAEALAAMGVDQADLAAAGSDDEPKAEDGQNTRENHWKRWKKRHQQKVMLRRNVLHGEAVVQTKNGPVTVMVQRGAVTAIDDTSVTVKSTDGFTLTWTFHEDLKVIEKRESIQPGEVEIGTAMALAGPKTGDNPSARLIVINNHKKD